MTTTLITTIATCSFFILFTIALSHTCSRAYVTSGPGDRKTRFLSVATLVTWVIFACSIQIISLIKDYPW